MTNDDGIQVTELDLLVTAYVGEELEGDDLLRFEKMMFEDPALHLKVLELVAVREVTQDLRRREALGERFDEAVYPNAYREARSIAALSDIPDGWPPDTEFVDEAQPVETTATEEPVEAHEPNHSLLDEIAGELGECDMPWIGTPKPLRFPRALDAGLKLFESSGLPDLTRRYTELEHEVGTHLLKTVRSAFVRRGGCYYASDEDTVVAEGTAFKLTSELSWLNRFLQIEARQLSGPVVPSRLLNVALPKSFGVVSCVACTLPEIAGVDYAWLEHALVEQLTSLYGTLRSTLIGHVEGIQRRLFDPIVGIINDQLKKSGKGDLVHTYFPGLGHQDIYCYFFDRGKMLEVADLLVENQLPDVGPCELMLELLRTRTEPHEALGVKSLYEKGPVRESFSRLNYRGAKQLFARAEQVVYRSPGHSVFSIAERNGYVLVIGMPDTLEEHIVPELNRVAAAVGQCLGNGLKGYSRFVDTMHQVRQRIVMPFDEQFVDVGARISAHDSLRIVSTADDGIETRSTT